MRADGKSGRRDKTGKAPIVGLFGLMGQGNLGNDGSMEALLSFLRTHHPDASVDALCSGPALIEAQYALPTADLHWHHPDRARKPGILELARRAAGTGLGMTIDTARLVRWVRRHDVVIVPGMGVLETTVPMRAWKSPYSMFLLSVSGKLFSTKVALVSIGANVIDERLMRYLITTAAKMAHYRSYRDQFSRDAMQKMGLDVSGDAVYPDVVFSLPEPRTAPATPKSVGLGIMDYCGRNVDRWQADDLRSSYIAKVTELALWFVDGGHQVRLITSDPMADDRIIRAIHEDLCAQRPDESASQIIAEPISCIGDLMRQTALVDAVVGTRYHTLVCALKLAKPTVSIGYAEKCEVLMTDMGLADFCQPAKSFDVNLVKRQFEELDGRSNELRAMLAEKSAARRATLEDQFAQLSDSLFSATQASGPPLARQLVQQA